MAPTARVIAALGVACGIACSAQGAAPSPSEARPVRAAWQARPPGGTQPIEPGTRDDALLDAQSCARCHAEIAAEWATSRHALAWTNGIFQREYGARPLAWCVNCHAPLTTQQAGRYRDAGVDCATCHVRGGALVNARKRPGSPHTTIEEPSFGSPAFCADCHEFTFPVLGDGGAVTRMTAHPMQSTVSSFRAGPYAQQRDGCMMCHGSRHNHAFLGGHDAGMLDAALEVAWCASGPELQLRVRNAAAGHNVPTGDIHRHMNLRVWRSSAPERLFEVYIGRRFDPADDGGKKLVWDSTIAPNETLEHAVPIAELGGEDDEPINLELIYVYLQNEFSTARRAPSEPFTRTIVRWREPASALARCASR